MKVEKYFCIFISLKLLAMEQKYCDERLRLGKARIWLNLFVLSFGYFSFFTGFWGLTSLQTTMNAEDGIGPISQAFLYGAALISSLLLPTFAIDTFGCKKVLIFALLLGAPYMASNMYLRWDLLILTSTLFGLMLGPYYSAQAVYVDELIVRYHKHTKQDLTYLKSLFFGILILFVEGTQITGNAISYFVISNKQEYDLNSVVPYNCGIRFIDRESETNGNLEAPSNYERNLLIGIYVLLAILSIFILCILEPLKNDIKRDSGWHSVYVPFLATMKHVLNPHQMFLIPISIYLAVGSTTYSNVFTQAYIACSWGVHHVGFVTICFGVCGAITALLVGPLVKCVSQMAVLLFAACSNVAICVLLFLWQPSPDTTTIYFVIAGVWGMGDAIWWSQITALYGLMFPSDREAAFSNLYFWSFLGFFLSYSYANYLTVAVKINILIAFLVAGMLGYLIGQFKIKCSSRKEYVHIEDQR